MISPVFTQEDRDLAENLFAQVARETTSPEGGVCRPSYGREETIAWQILAEQALDEGLHASSDVAGNLLIARQETLPPRATWIGSHLDSVPRGGNYDGLAGVVAALLVVRKSRELRVDVPLVGIGLRGEESAWFGVPYLGSKALLGKLSPHDLQRQCRSSSLTLGAALEKIGVQASRLLEGPIVTPQQIAAFWELHIEQGPVLVAKNKPVGIVTGIRGNVRVANACVRGQAGHSGTTPHDLRDDAVMRFAEIMMGLEMHRRSLAGDDLVFTCGIVGTDPKKHAITTIADEVRFALDVRSLDDRVARRFLRYAETLGVDLGAVAETPAALISPETTEHAARACRELGIDPQLMPSGAGHDAAVFQQCGIPAGMIFVRNDHGSHNPDEAMSLDDFMLGCEVLWRTIVNGEMR